MKTGKNSVLTPNSDVMQDSQQSKDYKTFEMNLRPFSPPSLLSNENRLHHAYLHLRLAVLLSVAKFAKKTGTYLKAWVLERN